MASFMFQARPINADAATAAADSATEAHTAVAGPISNLLTFLVCRLAFPRRGLLLYLK